MPEIFQTVDFKQRAETISLPEYDNKLLAYPILLEKLSNIDKVAEEHLTLGSVLIKGWMGIPDSDFDYNEEDLEFLLEGFNNAFNGDLYDLMDLALYYGDISGVTAFLHFTCPSFYPIHTPEIDINLYGAKASTSQWEEQYVIQYIEACQTLSDNLFNQYKRFNEAVKIVNKKLEQAGYDYTVGEMRAIEMCLLYGDESYKN